MSPRHSKYGAGIMQRQSRNRAIGWYPFVANHVFTLRRGPSSFTTTWITSVPCTTIGRHSRSSRRYYQRKQRCWRQAPNKSSNKWGTHVGWTSERQGNAIVFISAPLSDDRYLKRLFTIFTVFDRRKKWRRGNMAARNSRYRCGTKWRLPGSQESNI